MSNSPSASSPSGDAAPARHSELLSQGEPLAVADIRDALVIKEGELFLMTDPNGNLPSGDDGGYGLYKGDTRYLTVYDLSFDEVRPTVLLSNTELDYSSEHHLTNPAMVALDGRSVPKETIEVRRQRVIGTSLLETVQVTNFNIFPVTFGVCFRFSSDFLDIFEFRGETRERRGTLATPAVESDRVVLSYHGLDDIRRKTELRFSPTPEEVWETGARFVVSLGHLESLDISVAVVLDDADGATKYSTEFERVSASYTSSLAANTQVFTSNEFFNAMVERSLRDMRMLTVEGAEGNFIAAGTPWFSSLFGRDSLITAFQMLAFNPGVARDTLRVLARLQGKKSDDWRDEEPGKILHELRTGEMATLDEIPMTPYYGSIDSTPLFIMLAAQYVAWTDDRDLIRDILPNIETALLWL
ncbi:MAG: glycogen debranching N-terminal domain-containing protein, partial [Dehalococcoidia bacterium]